MSVKAVGITCVAAAISYGLGMIGGAVAISGSIGYLLAMIVASILVVRTASHTAMQDARWMEEQNVEIDTSNEYERGYEDGYSDAVESLQFVVPPTRQRHGKRRRKGA